ncbi:type IV pilus modification PilV family protein [Photobacterium sanguinicancri]|uniref:type IV pilus modification PilV family protein n=1 Tax=Photobacterium sanguinicancri TaxID=875932 RepID=UPI003D0F22AE
MTSKLPNQQRGFSLVEVLISVLVISISFVSVMKLQSYVEVRSEQNELQLHAMRIAQRQIDLWENVGGDVRCNGATVTLTLANLESCKTNFESFKSKVTKLNEITDSSGNILQKRLSVDVTWADREGNTGTVTLYSTQTASNALIRS